MAAGATSKTRGDNVVITTLQATKQQVLKNIEVADDGDHVEDLECSICCELFTDATNVDPCDHTFCGDCLERHCKRGGQMRRCIVNVSLVRLTLDDVSCQPSPCGRKSSRRDFATSCGPPTTPPCSACGC